MQQTLAALVEVLDVAGCDLISVRMECCGNGAGGDCFDSPPECCGCPIDSEQRVKNAIDALQKALGLQGSAA